MPFILDTAVTIVKLLIPITQRQTQSANLSFRELVVVDTRLNSFVDCCFDFRNTFLITLGDEEFDNGNRGVEYKGHYFINCSSKNKPGVVDSQAKPLFDAEAFFSGCYGRADVGFFPYNQAGNRGIGVGLNNLMMTKEGERLDGRQKAEDAFANFAAEGETSGDLE